LTVAVVVVVVVVVAAVAAVVESVVMAVAESVVAVAVASAVVAAVVAIVAITAAAAIGVVVGMVAGVPVVGLTEALSEVRAVVVAVAGLSRPEVPLSRLADFLTPLSHNCLLAEQVLFPLSTFRPSASSAGDTGTPGGWSDCAAITLRSISNKGRCTIMMARIIVLLRGQVTYESFDSRRNLVRQYM
jgi:hypothetical protein